jgi:type I restriction enzyme S subunit
MTEKRNNASNVPTLRFPGYTKNWSLKKLGDIGDVKMCKRIFNEQTLPEGDIPFYKIGSFGRTADAFINRELYLDFKKRFSFPKKGEILISAAGTIGRTVIYNGEEAYYQDSNIVWIENNELMVTNEFLYYILQIVKFNTEGGTIQRLYNNILRSTNFQCPEISEQRKITSFLEKIDARIQTQNKIIEELKLLKSTLCNQLIEACNGIPFKVSEIANIGRGRVISSSEINKQRNPSYPVYSSQTSNDGIMGYLDKYDFEGEYITWTTDGANAGTVFHRSGKFNCTNVCGVLKIKDTSKVNPSFVALALQRQTKKYVSINLANPKLMNNVMAGITIKLPQFEMQKKISNLNNLINSKIRNEHRFMTNLLIQKKYLLDKLFK